MRVIAKIAHIIDTTLVDYVQKVFESTAGPIRTLLIAIALVALLVIALNHIIQFQTVNYSIYLQWGLRYILVYSFATMWVNFQGIYTMLIEVPGDYVALMLKGVALTIESRNPRILDPARIKDVYSAMDEFTHATFQIGLDHLMPNVSIWKPAKLLREFFFGALFLVVGLFFTAGSAIVVLVGKIGLAVSISLAPLAIIMLMMPQTKQYFESWTRFTVGFAVIPLLTGALMTVVLYVAGEIYAPSTNYNLEFALIMIAATVLLYMIPTMASTLASASVAAVGAGAAASMAIAAGKKSYSGAQRLEDGARVASTARAAGASPGEAARSAISAMRQSTQMRKQRRDERLARGMVGQSSQRSEGNGAAAHPSGSSSRSRNRASSPEETNLYR
ncbi:MAG: type IV secretion system protein [Mesorhizobium sp.]|uniref:type IV secretion system protein n=1 Tax=Mesorhizobium sp. TaxID=1871066 RepID=UPI00121EA557|nr:type IV secretion system protein [Mesorhizobium sp.]TIL22207.1 MAG: type IV secretion system protein [Mesorhizobium sp.]